MTMTVDQYLLYAFAASRIALGAYSCIVPDVATKSLGIEKATTAEEGELVVRLYGARDLALGWILFVAKDNYSKELALQAGVIADGLDIMSILIGRKNGIKKETAGLLAGVAAAATGLGAYLLYQLKK
jgi:hypothetical protein